MTKVQFIAPGRVSSTIVSRLDDDDDDDINDYCLNLMNRDSILNEYDRLRFLECSLRCPLQ